MSSDTRHEAARDKARREYAHCIGNGGTVWEAFNKGWAECAAYDAARGGEAEGELQAAANDVLAVWDGDHESHVLESKLIDPIERLRAALSQHPEPRQVEGERQTRVLLRDLHRAAREVYENRNNHPDECSRREDDHEWEGQMQMLGIVLFEVEMSFGCEKHGRMPSERERMEAARKVYQQRRFGFVGAGSDPGFEAGYLAAYGERVERVRADEVQQGQRIWADEAFREVVRTAEDEGTVELWAAERTLLDTLDRDCFVLRLSEPRQVEGERDGANGAAPTAAAGSRKCT